MIKKSYPRLFPWGTLYSTRLNYKSGYLPAEGRLVSKYLTKPSTILILGAGNGREARPIGKNNHQIFCIDIGELYLHSGTTLCAKENLRDIYFLHADCRNLPFESESFDFIFFSLYSLLPNRREDAVDEMYKVLCPKGLVLLSASTPQYLSKHPHLKDLHIVLDAAQLEREVTAAGFNLLETEVDATRPEYRVAMLQKPAKQFT